MVVVEVVCVCVCVGGGGGGGRSEIVLLRKGQLIGYIRNVLCLRRGVPREDSGDAGDTGNAGPAMPVVWWHWKVFLFFANCVDWISEVQCIWMAYVSVKSELYLRSFSTHPLVLRCFLIIVWCRLEVTDARIYRLAHCHDTGWCQLAYDAGWRREFRECWILPVILIYMPSLFMPVVHKHAESWVGMQVNDFHHAILRLEVFTGNLCHVRSLISIDKQCIL